MLASSARVILAIEPPGTAARSAIPRRERSVLRRERLLGEVADARGGISRVGEATGRATARRRGLVVQSLRVSRPLARAPDLRRTALVHDTAAGLARDVRVGLVLRQLIQPPAALAALRDVVHVDPPVRG